MWLLHNVAELHAVVNILINHLKNTDTKCVWIHLTIWLNFFIGCVKNTFLVCQKQLFSEQAVLGVNDYCYVHYYIQQQNTSIA